MEEQERTDPHTWFKARQEVFSDLPLCPLHAAYDHSESILLLTFDVRTKVREILKDKKNELLDTVHFYVDTIMEDYQAILWLCRRGFFSSPTLILRRMLITWGRINYIRNHPEKTLQIRQGTMVTDKELIDELRSSGLLTNDEDYKLYCESTHANFLWASKTSVSRMLSPLDIQTFLAVECCLLEADRWALQSMRTSICLMGDFVGKIEPFERLINSINPLLLKSNDRFNEYEHRVDLYFGDI